MRVTKRLKGWRPLLIYFWVATSALTIAPLAVAGGDAPQWMHALLNVQLPSYDDKTDAVLLYSETNVAVLSEDRIRTHVREAYKILRPEGRERGTVDVYFDPEHKITSLRGWCIPAHGKDFEIKKKDATDFAAWGEVVLSDVKFRLLRIPAPGPGNMVGYEYEVEERPFWLQDIWDFQGADPVREAHYSLQFLQAGSSNLHGFPIPT